jgi:hypothetical protein
LRLRFALLVELGPEADLIPVPGKVERGTENGLQSQNPAVKMLALLQIADNDADVIVVFDFYHFRSAPKKFDLKNI